MSDLMKSPFLNDPFSIVYMAFKNLYPDKKCDIYWEPRIRDSESGEPAYGLTDFGEDGTIAVFVKPSIIVTDAVEILAHELAHVAVGLEAEHGEAWELAFSAIFEEYNRIGAEMAGGDSDESA